MKHYVIYDQKGDSWEDVLKTADREEAIAIADAEWDSLTTFDQKKREQFFLCYAELDEDGCVDFNTAEVVKEYVK